MVVVYWYYIFGNISILVNKSRQQSMLRTYDISPIVKATYSQYLIEICQRRIILEVSVDFRSIVDVNCR